MTPAVAESEGSGDRGWVQRPGRPRQRGAHHPRPPGATLPGVISPRDSGFTYLMRTSWVRWTHIGRWWDGCCCRRGSGSTPSQPHCCAGRPVSRVASPPAADYEDRHHEPSHPEAARSFTWPTATSPTRHLVNPQARSRGSLRPDRPEIVTKNKTSPTRRRTGGERPATRQQEPTRNDSKRQGRSPLAALPLVRGRRCVRSHGKDHSVL